MKPFILIFSFPLFVMAQPINNCFETSFKAGQDLLASKKYLAAIKNFEAALGCETFSEEEELRNTKQIKSWVDKANQAYINELTAARDSAQAATKRAQREAVLNEVNRLALIASNLTEAMQPEEAMFIANTALELAGDHPSPDIQRSFGNASLAFFRDTILPIKGSVTEINTIPGGQSLLITLNHKELLLIDPLEKKTKSLINHPDILIYDINFPANGDLITVAMSNGNLHVFDVAGNESEIINAHPEGLTSLCFAPDDQHILSCSRDNTARLWDRKGNLLASLGEHGGNVYQAAFSFDQHYILTRSSDGIVKLWDFKGKPQAKLALPGDYIYSAAFAPKSHEILTVSTSGIAHLWTIDGKQLAHFTSAKGILKAIEFLADAELIITYGEGSTAMIWNKNGELLYELSHQTGTINGVVISPSNQKILTYGTEGKAKLWDNYGQVLYQLEHNHPIIAACFSSDGQYLLTTTKNHETKLWSVNGHLLMNIETSFPPLFSSDDQYLIFFNGNHLMMTPVPALARQKLRSNSPFSSDWKTKAIKKYGIKYQK